MSDEEANVERQEDELEEEEEEEEEESGGGSEGDETESEEEEDEDHEFDDPEGYVDDIADEELLKDLLQKRPVEEADLDTVIVVDNAPKVGPDRMAKLKVVLNKVFARFGEIVTQDYPTDSNGIFKGYFFLEFASADQANNAVKAGNGYRLDKSHIFAVNHFRDFEKFSNLPANWQPPKKKEFVERGNLRSWLLDENCYDQCAIIHSAGELVAICQNTPNEIKVVTERKRWTETYVRWSPQGTYLATLHTQGVALWGGEKFERITRFNHSGVQLIDFSPCERYLVTFSNVVDNPENPQNIIVWDVKTGLKKRTFMKGSAEDWPILKWSHDGKYFGRMTDSLLSIYEVPSFGLMDKKSLVVKGIRDFSWSPKEYRIVYWVPEMGQIPAKIIIIEIPSRKEISTKSRHLVSDCKMHWHKQGDYLCVKVDHWMTKSKKQLCSSFEIFHMRETLIPVDTIEMKEPVIAFAFEPLGSKFAVVHGEPPTRISVTFFRIEKGATVSRIITLEKRSANHIFWSPGGQFVVLAGLNKTSSQSNVPALEGQLEFWDTGDMTLMNTAEHTMATDLEWDPTGRYVVTTVSYWSQKMDTGFCVWFFQGRLLYRNPVQVDKFCQLLWRPRPPSLLTEEDIKVVKKEQKKYYYMFEQKDRGIRSRASKDLVEKRQKMMRDFTDFRRKKAEDQKLKRKKFLEALEEEKEEEEEEEEEEGEEGGEIVEETIDILVQETEEFVD